MAALNNGLGLGQRQQQQQQQQTSRTHSVLASYEIRPRLQYNQYATRAPTPPRPNQRFHNTYRPTCTGWIVFTVHCEIVSNLEWTRQQLASNLQLYRTASIIYGGPTDKPDLQPVISLGLAYSKPNKHFCSLLASAFKSCSTQLLHRKAVASRGRGDGTVQNPQSLFRSKIILFKHSWPVRIKRIIPNDP